MIDADASVPDLALLLRLYRERADLSQNRLAREAGVDPSYVNRIEGGLQQTPSRRRVLALSRVLRLRPYERDDLLAAAGHCPESLLALPLSRRRRLLKRLVEVAR